MGALLVNGGRAWLMIRPIIPPVVCSLSTCPLVLVKKRSRASDFDSLEYT